MRILFIVLLAASAAGCSRQAAQPQYMPTATIKDIMLGLIDPSADAMWESVATIVTASGVEERQPRTEEEWIALRRAALQVVEGSNLLLIPGRIVAPAGDKSENPGIELHPEEIQPLIDNDRATWESRAKGLHDAAVPMLQAIDKRDVAALSAGGEKLDMACEMCHQTYWYPNEPKPPSE
jgi:cytochrome c556